MLFYGKHEFYAVFTIFNIQANRTCFETAPDKRLKLKCFRRCLKKAYRPKRTLKRKSTGNIKTNIKVAIK